MRGTKSILCFSIDQFRVDGFSELNLSSGTIWITKICAIDWSRTCCTRDRSPTVNEPEGLVTCRDAIARGGDPDFSA
jgi:hypothetical protein